MKLATSNLVRESLGKNLFIRKFDIIPDWKSIPQNFGFPFIIFAIARVGEIKVNKYWKC